MQGGYLDCRSLRHQAVPKAKVEVCGARVDLERVRAQVVELGPQGGDHRPGPGAALLSAHPGKRLVVRFHHLFGSHEAVLGGEDEPALASPLDPAPASDEEGAGLELWGPRPVAQLPLDASDEPAPLPERCGVPAHPKNDASPQPSLDAMPKRGTELAQAGPTPRRNGSGKAAPGVYCEPRCSRAGQDTSGAVRVAVVPTNCGPRPGKGTYLPCERATVSRNKAIHFAPRQQPSLKSGADGPPNTTTLSFQPATKRGSRWTQRCSTSMTRLSQVRHMM